MVTWLHEQKWPEVRDYLKEKSTILLPVGSVEQHGHHLPLMTDAAQANCLAEVLSDETGVMVASPLWYGWTPHHLAYPGSVTLRPEILAGLVEDVCLSLIYHGFDRIIVISGHRTMNLMPINPALMRVRNKTGAWVGLIDIALIAQQETIEIFESEVGGIGHACEAETSFMLHYRPDLVDMSKAVKGSSYHGGPLVTSVIPPDPRVKANRFAFYRTPEEYAEASASTQGVGGDATLATAEKGKRLLDAMVKNAKLVMDIAAKAKVTVKDRPIPV